MEISKKRFLEYIITFAIGMAFTVGVVLYENEVFGSSFSVVRRWCDGTFIASVMLLGAGGLTGIAENGGFDALRFAFVKMIDVIRHPKLDERHDEQTYYDYVKAKHSGKKKEFVFMLIIGGVFLAATLILLIFAY